MLILGTALALAGIPLAVAILAVADPTIGRILAAVLLLAATVQLVIVGLMWRQPRLAFDGQSLLAYLQGPRPIRIPIEIVEAFLLGQGPALLPGEKHARTETATIVIKLSDRAEEWSHVAVDSRLASWCDSYITIRGTWTEPLNLAVVRRLNERLAAISRPVPERAAR